MHVDLLAISWPLLALLSGYSGACFAAGWFGRRVALRALATRLWNTEQDVEALRERFERFSGKHHMREARAAKTADQVLRDEAAALIGSATPAQLPPAGSPGRKASLRAAAARLVKLQ